MVPSCLPTLTRKNYSASLKCVFLLLTNIITVSDVLQSKVERSCCNFECIAWVTACIFLETVCTNVEKNMLCFPTVIGENKAHCSVTLFTDVFQFFHLESLLRNKIHTSYKSNYTEEWNKNTCLVRDASTPLEIIS